MPPLAIAGAVAGGAAGYFGSQGKQLGAQSAYGAAGQNAAMSGLSGMQDLVNAGPGVDQEKQYVQSGEDMAGLIQNYMNNNGMPTATDQQNAQAFASNMFAPQQVGLQQSFLNQGYAANQSAALMGRSGSDPILQAKMRTSMTQQQNMLNAQQNAFASQYAMNLPQQRIGLAGQRMSVLGGLASQAMANRQALVSAGAQMYGQGLQQQEFTAHNNPIAGTITGMMGGMGAGASAASYFGGEGSSKGPVSNVGAMTTPTSANNYGASNYFQQPYQFGASSNPFSGSGSPYHL